MAWTPSADDVHAVIPQRGAPGFTEASVPTADQVVAIGTNTQAELQAYIGQDVALDAEDEQLGRFAASTGAAARVERGLFPEQSQRDDSTYAQLWADYRQLAAQLYYAVHGEWPTHLIDEIPDEDEIVGAGPLPAGHFPEHDWIGHRGW